jgi:DNA-binding MarR family transcriptional regulator
MLGVLPAQMSRIIRSLEARDRPLIVCRINPADKRKINVTLTPAGLQALTDYQATHLSGLHALIDRLSEEDREDLARLLDKLGGALGHEAEALPAGINGHDA